MVEMGGLVVTYEFRSGGFEGGEGGGGEGEVVGGMVGR